ncbi:MAG: oxaloacetate decarboxylase, partial [Bacteroidales bacterium]|nr:oxaloacetate decarboxylase [Bacteroidales bacterium]
GIGRPVSLGKIVSYIKSKYPNITIQYHGQTGPGFTPASILEVAKAGCDIIDVGMEPLSWGTGHADVIMVREMLKDAGFDVPEINMGAYMRARTLTQEFMDDFLGYYIPESNRRLTSLLIGCGLPGGMMGSLMNDLTTNLESINKSRAKLGKPAYTTDDLMVKMFDEVAYVWPRVGFPPLVTPFSQYVKNLALFNLMQLEKGKERWTMIADNIWDMILGKSGKLPGEVAPELKELAAKQGREFFTGNPQDLYPDKLDEFRKEMDANGWEYGQDDEELFELAMHPEQYRAYKSGKAKADFEADLAAKKAAKANVGSLKPQSLTVDVNGEKFAVTVSYDAPKADAPKAAAAAAPSAPVSGNATDVVAPISGKFFKTKDSSAKAVAVGDMVKEGDIVGYIEAMKVFNAVAAPASGKVVEICRNSGDDVDEDDVLMKIQ